MSDQKIEIFRYGFENELTGYMMDEDHIDKEFEDIEICHIDEH